MSDLTKVHELEKDLGSLETKARMENPENYFFCQVSTGTSPIITESESLQISNCDDSKCGELDSIATSALSKEERQVKEQVNIEDPRVSLDTLEERSASPSTREEEAICDQSAKEKIEKVLSDYGLCSSKFHNLLVSLIKNTMKLVKNIEKQKLSTKNLFGCDQTTVLTELLALNEKIRQEEGQGLTEIWYYWMLDFHMRNGKSYNELAFREWFGLPGMSKFYLKALELILETLEPRAVFIKLRANIECCNSDSCGKECKLKLAEVRDVWKNLIFVAIEPRRYIPSKLHSLSLDVVKQQIIKFEADAKASRNARTAIKRRGRSIVQCPLKKTCFSKGSAPPNALINVQVSSPNTGADPDFLRPTSEQPRQCPDCPQLSLNPYEKICQLLSRFLSAYYDIQNAQLRIDSMSDPDENAELRNVLKKSKTHPSLGKDAREIADMFGDFFKKSPPQVTDTDFAYCYKAELFEQLLRSHSARGFETLTKLQPFYDWSKDASNTLAACLITLSHLGNRR